MKKIISMMLVVLLCLGCGVGLSDQPRRLRVVATNYPCFDFARAVSGDLADIAMLLSPGAESHSYEPTPQDIIAIQNCDVFVCVGGESDAWVDALLESMDTAGMRIVKLMDCVDAVEEQPVEGMQLDADHADEEHEYDEHVWTSPSNVKPIARQLADAFGLADPVNADAYRANSDAYSEQLDALDAALQGVVSGAARDTIVFGDRFPFRYLADAYGLSYFAAFPGCATETEPSAKTVAFLIDKVRDERIPVVFHIEMGNEKMADTICEATGANKRLLHACHNISRDDFAAGLTYLDLMARNVDALREALS